MCKSVRYIAITAAVVRREEEAQYYSRGQKHLFVAALAEDKVKRVRQPRVEDVPEEEVEERVPMRATG